MGEVYKARDTRLGRTVAIKVLPAGVAADPERRALRRESKAVAGLNHPHICALYDVGARCRPATTGPLEPTPVRLTRRGRRGADRACTGPVGFLVMEHQGTLARPVLSARRSNSRSRSRMP
jgi:serine/threonine protein kinase